MSATGKRGDDLTSAERQELARLKRENKQLRLERESWQRRRRENGSVSSASHALCASPAWGGRPSMGTVGDCFDNAMCESFFATLECELLAQNRFQTREQAEQATFAFIEGWYNTQRLHSSWAICHRWILKGGISPRNTGYPPRRRRQPMKGLAASPWITLRRVNFWRAKFNCKTVD